MVLQVTESANFRAEAVRGRVSGETAEVRRVPAVPFWVFGVL